jgi:hypothetical protein
MMFGIMLIAFGVIGWACCMAMLCICIDSNTKKIVAAIDRLKDKE